MRVVLDTNVVASAMLWGGAPLRLLQAARAGRLSLCTSAPLLDELCEILGRPKFERKLAAARCSPEQLVAGYAALAAAFRPTPVPRLAPDPDDDIVIGTALAAHATLIVTGDKPLLSVGTHAGIRIVTVSGAIAALDADPSGRH